MKEQLPLLSFRRIVQAHGCCIALRMIVPHGSQYQVRSYVILLDSSSQLERRGVAAFALDAVKAGYSQVHGPIVLPSSAFRDPAGEQPLTAVYFFLEKRQS